MAHRALITGVSGFAGPYLAQHLLDCGDEVLGASPDGSWPDRLPETVCPKVELIAWDISRPDGLCETSRRSIQRFRPQVVYHLAAISVPAECGEDQPRPQAVAVNVEGTRRVLEAAVALDWPPRVLLASTSHVYAPVEESSPRVDENWPLGAPPGLRPHQVGRRDGRPPGDHLGPGRPDRAGLPAHRPRPTAADDAARVGRAVRPRRPRTGPGADTSTPGST